MSGTFRLKQTNYGIKPYSAAGGLAKVADELEISGDLELKPKLPSTWYAAGSPVSYITESRTWSVDSRT